MGNSCSVRRNEILEYYSSSEEDNPGDVYIAPDPINEIMGVSVDREKGLYQYTLFAVTRLADRYKNFLFPLITMNIGSFREDFKDYSVLCNELYHDMCFEERCIPNKRVDGQDDVLAKEAISELAFEFLVTNSQGQGFPVATEGNDLIEEGSRLTYKEIKPRLDSITDYQMCYEDTLKMIITDLERKEIWQMSTLFSNIDFQECLKEREPETFKSLCDESLIIEVPCTAKVAKEEHFTNELAADYALPEY